MKITVADMWPRCIVNYWDQKSDTVYKNTLCKVLDMDYDEYARLKKKSSKKKHKTIYMSY